MDVQILGSGSGGNCYLFSDERARILVECGLGYKITMTGLHYQLPDAVLITHEHSDHSKSAKQFLENGIPMYMTRGTAKALKLNRHNLHFIEANKPFYVKGIEILPMSAIHDAAEPVCFIIDKEILFVTDTGFVPNVTGDFKKVLIEANYERETLYRNEGHLKLRMRIFENHLSIVQAKEFLRTIDEPEEVHLIHISRRNGDAADFVRQVKVATGFKNVFAG